MTTMKENPEQFFKEKADAYRQQLQAEFLKSNVDYARKYGYAVGLLKGLILQSEKLGIKYVIDADVFELVKTGLAELENE